MKKTRLARRPRHAPATLRPGDLLEVQSVSAEVRCACPARISWGEPDEPDVAPERFSDATGDLGQQLSFDTPVLPGAPFGREPISSRGAAPIPRVMVIATQARAGSGSPTKAGPQRSTRGRNWAWRRGRLRTLQLSVLEWCTAFHAQLRETLMGSLDACVAMQAEKAKQDPPRA